MGNVVVMHWGHVALGAGACVALVAGCQNSGTDRDLERMVNQAYYQVYENCEFFPDHRAMREPPEGTLPADHIVLPAAVERGIVDGKYVEKNPVLLTTAIVEMGQRRFDVYCAPCHGVQGNGASVVARKMALRPPPSLVSDRVQQFPDGRIFSVITEGYGLMPQYSQELGVIERWAVVAYVRALGLREAGMPLERLPQPLRLEAEKTLQ